MGVMGSVGSDGVHGFWWGPWGGGWEVSALPTQISPLEPIEPIEPTRTYRPQILHQNPRNHHPLTFNYLPSEYKHDSFELRFTPSLNFEATGERVPFSMLKEHNEERDERAEQARAMRDEGMTLQQIADALGYKSPSTVLNLLNKE